MSICTTCHVDNSDGMDVTYTCPDCVDDIAAIDDIMRGREARDREARDREARVGTLWHFEPWRLMQLRDPLSVRVERTNDNVPIYVPGLAGGWLPFLQGDPPPGTNWTRNAVLEGRLHQLIVSSGPGLYAVTVSDGEPVNPATMCWHVLVTTPAEAVESGDGLRVARAALSAVQDLGGASGGAGTEVPRISSPAPPVPPRQGMRGTIGVRVRGATLSIAGIGDVGEPRHWVGMIEHVNIRWGEVLHLENFRGTRIASNDQMLIYSVGVITPPGASRDLEDLGDLSLTIDDSARLGFIAPVLALAARQLNLGDLESWFSPRALWTVADELRKRLEATSSEEASHAEAVKNLEMVRLYISAVHAEYAAYTAAGGPGQAIPLNVARGSRLTLRHEIVVNRDGRGNKTIDVGPSRWSRGFTVEITGLRKPRVDSDDSDDV